MLVFISIGNIAKIRFYGFVFFSLMLQEQRQDIKQIVTLLKVSSTVLDFTKLRHISDQIFLNFGQIPLANF